MSMGFPRVQPVHNEPALFIQDKKILVIADLHIGVENQLKEQGLNVSSQTHNMITRLFSLCKKFKPDEIILLGDVKHNIPSSTIQERRDVKIFLEKIQRYGVVHIIPGNHDGNIDKLSPKDVIIHPSGGFSIDDIKPSGTIHNFANEILLNITESLVEKKILERIGPLKYRLVKDCESISGIHECKVKYPELDDLHESEYIVIDELAPILLERYVMERLGLETRPLDEVIDELEWIEEVGARIDEKTLKSLYQEMIERIREGRLGVFIKELPKRIIKKS